MLDSLRVQSESVVSTEAEKGLIDLANFISDYQLYIAAKKEDSYSYQDALIDILSELKERHPEVEQFRNDANFKTT